MANERERERKELKNRTVYRLYRKDKPKSKKDSYVGSTGKSLKERLSKHKYSAKTERRTSKVYERMRNVGTENWEVEELTTLCCDADMIEEFESTWTLIIEPGLNTYSQTGLDITDYTDKAEYDCEYGREYREQNKVKIREYANERVVCEVCANTYPRCNKSHHEKSPFHTNVKWVIENLLWELD